MTATFEIQTEIVASSMTFSRALAPRTK